MAKHEHANDLKMPLYRHAYHVKCAGKLGLLPKGYVISLGYCDCSDHAKVSIRTSHKRDEAGYSQLRPVWLIVFHVHH
jgi:hypothetical protein